MWLTLLTLSPSAVTKGVFSPEPTAVTGGYILDKKGIQRGQSHSFDSLVRKILHQSMYEAFIQDGEKAKEARFASEERGTYRAAVRRSSEEKQTKTNGLEGKRVMNKSSVLRCHGKHTLLPVGSTPSPQKTQLAL